MMCWYCTQIHISGNSIGIECMNCLMKYIPHVLRLIIGYRVSAKNVLEQCIKRKERVFSSNHNKYLKFKCTLVDQNISKYSIITWLFLFLSEAINWFIFLRICCITFDCGVVFQTFREQNAY